MNATFDLKWVVHGHGKRAVVVYARNIDFNDDLIPPSVVDEICQTMAHLASRRGWKKIVIMRGRDQFNPNRPTGSFQFIGTNMSGLTNSKFHRVYSVVVESNELGSIPQEDLNDIW